MLYIKNLSLDPRYNLALEHHVFENLPKEHSYCILWRNRNAVIVGRHQNTHAEINASFVKERGIAVVRRMSGGGAVYHDDGNVNFTIIAPQPQNGRLDFSVFCQPVIQALQGFGVQAEQLGRNDMVIEGKKFSGNAQYLKHGRIMHHGTLLYDSDLDVMTQALQVDPGKVESKGLASVRSRVTNIKPYMPEGVAITDFIAALRSSIVGPDEAAEYHITVQDLEQIQRIREQYYNSWEWNFGRSPVCTVHKQRRFEGCGSVAAHLSVDKGCIQECTFTGDFFCSAAPSELAGMLRGVRFEEKALRAALAPVDIGTYFFALEREAFIQLLVE